MSRFLWSNLITFKKIPTRSQEVDLLDTKLLSHLVKHTAVLMFHPVVYHRGGDKQAAQPGR